MAVKRLGRGLGALIPEIVSEDTSRAERLSEIEVSRISPNPFQPRDNFEPQALAELKQSIAENGIIQPITVRIVDSGYELIAGERRLRAVKELGFERIPAFVLDVTTDEAMLELSLIENIQRENLNPIDEAKGYQTLISRCELTQDEVAKKVGKERSTITNALRLLKLPDVIQKSLIAGEISAGHARALLSLSDRGEQIGLWKRTVKSKLSVRQLENLVKKNQAPPKAEKKSDAPLDPLLRETEDRLRSALGTQVRITQNSKGGGKIEIEYYSDGDIERILELLEKK